MLQFWGAGINTFQPKKIVAYGGTEKYDAIWHHTFNSVLHMLQFLGAGINTFQPKKL
jgi:hypothetical protein